MSFKKIILILVILGIIVFVSYPFFVPSKVEETSSNSTSKPAEAPEKTEPTLAEKKLSEMTLEQKIGQLFIIRPDALDAVTSVGNNTGNLLNQYPVGGIALFKQNITSPEQLSKLTSDFQSLSSTPLFIGIDEEGGTVARIANSTGFNVTKFDNMGTIGATGDTNNAVYVGKTIGSYLKQYGVNLDFAPIADVNTNPSNPIIGKRAFGSDPALVSKMVSSAISGFHESGIMTSIKHFPGHGDTTGDTHKGTVSVTKTWEEMVNCEIIPFKENLDNTDMVMIAHISTPNATSDGLPSTLSSEMVNGKLRGELGYNGVVITDSFEMEAISKNYAESDAIIKSINAGVDIILMPNNFTEAFNTVKTAVENGTISEERINESVLRILNLKEKYGMLQEN